MSGKFCNCVWEKQTIFQRLFAAVVEAGAEVFSVVPQRVSPGRLVSADNGTGPRPMRERNRRAPAGRRSQASANERTSLSSEPQSRPFGLSRGPGAVRTTLLMAQSPFVRRQDARFSGSPCWQASHSGSFWTALHLFLTPEHQTSTVVFAKGMVVMTMMVLYAGSMMTSLMAVLTSCGPLWGDRVRHNSRHSH